MKVLISFLLTRPSRGATQEGLSQKIELQISTHTPLAGRDCIVYQGRNRPYDFYSHAPRGARRVLEPGEVERIGFLLTRPSRGATTFFMSFTLSAIISTHTPLAGRDELSYNYTRLFPISTHTPLAGRDYYRARSCDINAISTHTPLAGRDPGDRPAVDAPGRFLLTRPSRGATYYCLHIPHL